MKLIDFLYRFRKVKNWSKAVKRIIINFYCVVLLAQSWFETEKQTTETESAIAEDLPEEAEQPSIPTGSATELQCHVCHDEFKQFYNEEMEEWHIKPAVVFEGNNFHPCCLEDHKVSNYLIFPFNYCQSCIIISIV